MYYLYEGLTYLCCDNPSIRTYSFKRGICHIVQSAIYPFLGNKYVIYIFLVRLDHSKHIHTHVYIYIYICVCVCVCVCVFLCVWSKSFMPLTSRFTTLITHQHKLLKGIEKRSKCWVTVKWSSIDEINTHNSWAYLFLLLSHFCFNYEASSFDSTF